MSSVTRVEDLTKSSIGIWARGRGGGVAEAPPKCNGQLTFVGQQKKFWQSQFLKKFA